MWICRYCFGTNIIKIKCGKHECKGKRCIGCSSCDSCLIHHTDEQLNNLIERDSKALKEIEEIISGMNQVNPDGTITVTYKKRLVPATDITQKELEQETLEYANLYCGGLQTVNCMKYELQRRSIKSKDNLTEFDKINGLRI